MPAEMLGTLGRIISLAGLLRQEARNRGLSKARSADEFHAEMVETCDALVEIEDVESDKAALLHARVKGFYDVATAHCRTRGEAEGFVIPALSSARIYYWARKLEGREAEIGRLLAERRPWSSSFDALLGMLVSRVSERERAASGDSLLPRTIDAIQLEKDRAAELQMLLEASLGDVRRACVDDIAMLRTGRWR